MVMTKSFSENKKQSGHATNALSFAVALTLAALLLLNEASTQMYATASSSSLLSGGVLLAAATQSGLDEEGDGSSYILPDRLRRAVVALSTREAPGTVIIDTGNTTLYYVIGQGRAIRYGVGVGREGFTWSGTQTISRKAEWPDWHPPVQMIVSGMSFHARPVATIES
jgi:lipoprotein-anchoring transpeptidase ErfK/SrfK